MDWTASLQTFKELPSFEALTARAIPIALADALDYIAQHPSEPWNRPQDNPLTTLIIHQDPEDKERWVCFNHEPMMGEQFLKSGNATLTLKQWHRQVSPSLKQVWALHLPVKEVPAMSTTVRNYPKEMQIILGEGKRLPASKPFDPFEL